MDTSIQWQQMDTEEHKSGMRLECHACHTVEYFGDSPAGDLALYKARDTHKLNCSEGAYVGESPKQDAPWCA